eukprot:3498273-Karenia_brevis.AAC.1
MVANMEWLHGVNKKRLHDVGHGSACKTQMGMIWKLGYGCQHGYGTAVMTWIWLPTWNGCMK